MHVCLYNVSIWYNVCAVYLLSYKFHTYLAFITLILTNLCACVRACVCVCVSLHGCMM